MSDPGQFPGRGGGHRGGGLRVAQRAGGRGQGQAAPVGHRGPGALQVTGCPLSSVPCDDAPVICPLCPVMMPLWWQVSVPVLLPQQRGRGGGLLPALPPQLGHGGHLGPGGEVTQHRRHS